MSMLEIALSCIERGWFVFPCIPKTKKPLTKQGFKDASNSRDTIEAWWTNYPDANVAIATGPSGLTVVDYDHGLTGVADFANLETGRTYAVRTGRTDGFGVQQYFQGSGLKSTGWEKDGLKGDIRSATGYVMAAGCVHPSGEPYTVLVDAPLLPVPDWVRALAPAHETFDPATAVDNETADEWKTWLLEYAAHYQLGLRGYEKRAPNGWWLGIECPWTTEHTSGPGAESSTVLGILDGKLAFECSHGTCKAKKRDTAVFKAEMLSRRGDYVPEPGADPVVMLGSGKKEAAFVAPADWRTMFHTQEEVVNCPPPTFLIENFLAKQAICAIAAPVAQRKSLIALNVARSLCTGEALFGCLEVVNRPTRVLYLCPEMGLISLSGRIRNMGIQSCLGDTLFMRSMNLGDLKLSDIPDEALFGSVLIVDTAVRFMAGDENSVSDTRAFSQVLFDTQRRQGQDGAIVVLYHSPKATKSVDELTLENCLRGSGELGAAITDAHGTRLQEAAPDKAYGSTSFISHIKARDYEGLPNFEVSCNLETAIMTRVGEPGVRAVLATKTGGYKANKDGLDDAAKTFIREHPELSIRDTVAALAEIGIKRQKTWVSDTRSALNGSGCKHTE
jgi:hypothetical protein